MILKCWRNLAEIFRNCQQLSLFDDFAEDSKIVEAGGFNRIGEKYSRESADDETEREGEKRDDNA